METGGGNGDERIYTLSVVGEGFRLKNPDTALKLSEEGISYELYGRRGLRPFAQLRGVQMQSINGGRNGPWESMIKLTFERGKPLTVLSTSSWGGDDKQRDPVFIAFVEDLHRRIPQREHGHITFLRGVSEGQFKLTAFAVVILALLFGGAALLLVFQTLHGRNSVFEILGGVAGLIGLVWWALQSRARNRPGTYDPRYPPRDLYPE